MKCAECSGKTTVTHTQQEVGGLGVIRWRKCLECGHKVLTYEEASRRAGLHLSDESRKLLLKYGELSAPRRKLVQQLVGYLKRS